MPFKPPPVQPDFSSLITSLDNSKVQVSNYSLYQTIFFLITNAARARDLLVDDIDTINEVVSAILAATFLTVNNETIIFPNSRRLLPGTTIFFDDSVAGERTINSELPVGTVYSTYVNVNPSTLLGYGTWLLFATGIKDLSADITFTVY